MNDALYQPFPVVPGRRGQIWRYQPNHRRPRHFHAEPELNLITGGTAKFGFGDATVRVATGDLLFWHPGQDHELLESSPDFDLFVVGLTPELSRRVLGAQGGPAYPGPIRLRLGDANLEALRALCGAPLESTECSVVESQVATFWRQAHALRLAPGNTYALTGRVLTSVIVEPDLGRSAIASRARAYPTEVSRRFHQDMGTTLSRYRGRVRLLRFIEAVDAGESTLLSAAMRAGFGSYSQCHRVFVRTLGCTPREFFGQEARALMTDALAPFEQTTLPR